jgi:diguanylate cyclase (GGDEF)-like protein/PAS domain S-box-containing protein
MPVQRVLPANCGLNAAGERADKPYTVILRLAEEWEQRTMPQESGRGQPEEWYRYALALEASQEGFWDWDLVAGRLWGSHRWQALTGVGGECSRLEAWMERVHPHDQTALEADLRAIRAGEARRLENEHRIRHEDGQWRWVLARGVAGEDGHGRVTHIAGSLTDLTEHRTADALTGLPNRLCFIDHLERRMERGRLRGDWRFAVLALVVDRFERVNETLGSAGGDRLLMETALRLQAVLPEASLAAHLSGAEFLVCLEGIHGEAEAVGFATEAGVAFREPFVWRGHRVSPQVAIGIAQACPGCAHPEELVGRAESALAHARGQEPAGVVCYSEGMRERALEKLALEGDLERAIREGALTMFYQPEVDLRTSRIIGFEALVRWRHARLGLLPPAEFIPMAEETGLILPLGDWGLREACQQMVKWRAGNPLFTGVRISVNLSARQFEQGDLVERVRQVLEETQLSPGSLRLEVTESSVIADAPGAVKTMRELGRLGVGLHMDDFGVGYSSLQYLRNFPFDTLKIDRSFIREIARDRESQQIVRSILDLASSFGLDVVAEGIEDAEQLEELKSLGCPCGQGYYFARPMDAGGIDALLESGALRGNETALAQA